MKIRRAIFKDVIFFLGAGFSSPWVPTMRDFTEAFERYYCFSKIHATEIKIVDTRLKQAGVASDDSPELVKEKLLYWFTGDDTKMKQDPLTMRLNKLWKVRKLREKSSPLGDCYGLWKVARNTGKLLQGELYDIETILDHLNFTHFFKLLKKRYKNPYNKGEIDDYLIDKWLEDFHIPVFHEIRFKKIDKEYINFPLIEGDIEAHRSEKHHRFNLEITKRLSMLRKKILEFIKLRCAVQIDRKRLNEYFNPFLEIVPRSNIDIYTTNYDKLIETYFKNNNTDVEIGMEFDPINSVKKYNKNRLFSHTKKTRVIKLHGSIDYYTTENGQILQIDSADSHILPSGERLVDLMIYPLPEKPLGKDYYKQSFNHLRKALRFAGICIVVGFSFRDKHINSIFKYAIKKNPKIKIILIDPMADKILNDRLGFMKKNIIVHSCCFAEIAIHKERIAQSIGK